MYQNWNATPLDLYDMMSPSSPKHLDVRNAIEGHRLGERAPVPFHPDNVEGVL